MVTIGGGKPLFDTFHVMTGRQIRGKYAADMALAMTRALSVILDSL